MKDKIRIKAEYMSLDYDCPDVYFIIIEVVDEIPVRTYTVKLPQPYTLFPFNLYIKN